MEIVFSTFNARYSHTALALRCLRANLGDLRNRSAIAEFDNSLSPQAAAEILLEHHPQVILFSVYIWNLTVTTETAAILRAIRPELSIVIGGPEVSYDYEDLALFRTADHLICGEGEEVIEPVCRALLQDRQDAGGTGSAPQVDRLPKVISAPAVDLKTIALPYGEYTGEDIARRRIYIETLRGCPFQCEYCLSALDPGVRFFPPDRIFPELTKLIERGARTYKLIDRTFNIRTAHAAAVLRFFLENRRDGMMIHLEWEPGRLSPTLEALLAEAPPGFFQLEVGVQTFDSEVAKRIQRSLDPERVEQNIRRLAALPSVHLHTDLIAGLPGETMESLARGFDRLHACGPDEIQLGLLKKLRGSLIARHDTEWGMAYSSVPPCDVLKTSTLSFQELQSIRRFARFWDITVNNGRFSETAALLWKNQPSVFAAFMEWSEWLHQQTGVSAGIAPSRLARFLETFLTATRGLAQAPVRRALEAGIARRPVRTVKGRERQTRHAAQSSPLR